MAIHPHVATFRASDAAVANPPSCSLSPPSSEADLEAAARTPLTYLSKKARLSSRAW